MGLWTGLQLLLVVCTALTDADFVCNHCDCYGTTINCTARNLEHHPNASEWPTDMVVTYVVMDNNGLVHVTQYPPMAVLHLSLSHNRIVRIDGEAFLHLPNLTELDLSHNEITSDNLIADVFKGTYAPDEYKPLTNLHILKLSYNAIHMLRSDLFDHTPNLKILTLDSNPFKVLDSATVMALSTLTYLEVLDLSYTQLMDLPEYLLHTPKYIRVLNLTGNLMTRVPAALQHTHALEVLYFSDNPVIVLDHSSFQSEMPYLRELHISNMPNLTFISSGAMSKLVSLQEVYIGHNHHLSDISPDAFSSRKDNEESEQWPPIVKLDVGHNNLGALDRHLLGHWDVLQYLNLEGNPWVCDCENQWMVSTLLPTVEKIVQDQLDSLECSQPDQMRGRKLHELEVRDYHMRCMDTAGNHPEKDGKLLIGMLVGVLLAIPVTLILLLLLRNSRFGSRFFSRGPAAYSRTFYSPTDSAEH
ncbi:hypothetical protein Cfor_05203 [Coptotermes formosanus]|uniref:LRRCT domain-containing protein n=1 Tax=Coptotermes formosanus TaxID=36987 RepID=A0A6L2Q1E7_COPFO|nr:hypothetical protein Cfor_05203 [Coptotermes formosanus]